MSRLTISLIRKYLYKSELNKREVYVIKMRFGLTNIFLTLKQVGEKLGITRERARQIEAKGLSKLRWKMKQDGVDMEDIWTDAKGLKKKSKRSEKHSITIGLGRKSISNLIKEFDMVVKREVVDKLIGKKDV